MTRQPAIDVGIAFIVTFQAHSHPPLLVRQAVIVLNLPVAFLAGNFAVDVPLMVEQNVLGDVVDFFPGRGCFGVVIFMLLLDPGMFFDNVIMAVQALLHRRYAGVIRICHIGMAVLALDLLDTAMHSMAEGNRLFRAECTPRPCPEHVDKGASCQNGNKSQKNDYRIFSQRFIPCQKSV